MKTLYILYDQQCALCLRCRNWLGQQEAFVNLHFIPMQSPEATLRFPGIEKMGLGEELLVVSDGGEVYRGGEAWIMCLWALVEYREWSLRLATPLLMPLARRACELISTNRLELSAWLMFREPEAIQQVLQSQSAPLCDAARCAPAPKRRVTLPPPLPHELTQR